MQPMKNTNSKRQAATVTYAVLVRSEHEERSLAEAAVYLLFILSAVFSIWQAAHQPVVTPTALVTQTTNYAQAAAAAHQQGT